MHCFTGSDNCQPALLCLKLVLVFAQFSNLLTAEHSAKMSDQDKYRRLGGPQVAQG